MAYGKRIVCDATSGVTFEEELTDDEKVEKDAAKKAWEDSAPTRAWARLREERDRRIVATDWRAMPDLTLSDAWKTYRQELRDLPGTLNDTTVQKIFREVDGDIDWPTEPS